MESPRESPWLFNVPATVTSPVRSLPAPVISRVAPSATSPAVPPPTLPRLMGAVGVPTAPVKASSPASTSRVSVAPAASEVTSVNSARPAPSFVRVPCTSGMASAAPVNVASVSSVASETSSAPVVSSMVVPAKPRVSSQSSGAGVTPPTSRVAPSWRVRAPIRAPPCTVTAPVLPARTVTGLL